MDDDKIVMIPFRFAPLDWVTVTFAGVNYRGRVSRCHLFPGAIQEFTVEYVNDVGDFKSGEFRSDELLPQPGLP